MALIPEEIIAQVIDRSDVVETVGFYLPLKRAGRNFKANCPFHHEKTPSFIVNPDKQIYHCFGCGEGGNVVSFVMKHDHLDFPEAVRLLAKRANIEIPSAEKTTGRNENIRQLIFKVNALAVNIIIKVCSLTKIKRPKKPARICKTARSFKKRRVVFS